MNAPMHLAKSSTSSTEHDVRASTMQLQAHTHQSTVYASRSSGIPTACTQYPQCTQRTSQPADTERGHHEGRLEDAHALVDGEVVVEERYAHTPRHTAGYSLETRQEGMELAVRRSEVRVFASLNGRRWALRVTMPLNNRQSE